MDAVPTLGVAAVLCLRYAGFDTVPTGGRTPALMELRGTTDHLISVLTPRTSPLALPVSPSLLVTRDWCPLSPSPLTSVDVELHRVAALGEVGLAAVLPTVVDCGRRDEVAGGAVGQQGSAAPPPCGIVPLSVGPLALQGHIVLLEQPVPLRVQGHHSLPLVF